MDGPIAALALEQHGIVTRSQLSALGFTRHEIDDRIAAGRLHRVHQGVYAVGYRRLSSEARWLAALLAAGDGAVLSHESAAALWQLRAGSGRLIDVTVPMKRRAPDGVRIHRCELHPSEIVKRGSLRVTSPTRTLLDLAAQVDERQLERALREAIYLRLTSVAALTSCLSSHQGRRGSRNLRKLLPDATNGRLRSDLEQEFLTFLRKHKLPLPMQNTSVEGFESDCVWPEQHLIVELDGGAAHNTPHAFEADRARDETLVAAGWRVIRVTDARLGKQADALAAHFRQLLA
ncbi:MAG: hypothetical protein QOH13_327 [Thermoleophilaceae bacterium]|nr:hypothetical protein [Thermoleophilaceae bacterium]